MGILDWFSRKKQIKLLSYSSLNIDVLSTYVRYNNDFIKRLNIIDQELELLISGARKKQGSQDVVKIVREEHINSLIAELNEIKTMMQLLEKESTKVIAGLRNALK